MVFRGFRQTFMCMLSVIFSLYLLKKEEKNKNLIILLLLSALGTLFYGRIGLICCLIAIIVLLPKFKLTYNNIKKIIIVFLIVSMIFLIVDNLKDKNELINKWYNWAFSIFISLENNDNISENKSITSVTDMWFLPETETLLIGDGQYTTSSGGYYMNVDVGFLRPILFYGVFWTIVAYLVFIFIILGIKKRFNQKFDKFGNTIATIILLAVVFFEAKGEIFYFAISLIIPIYMLQGYEHNKEVNTELNYIDKIMK